jgi:signal transduction histidine kinase/CheY-like chemotaxis protein
MSVRPRVGRTIRLRDAASVVFALVAILPILLLVYLLSRADLLQHPEAQLGVFLALVVSVGGFLVFRRMTDQIARLAEGLQSPGTGQDRAPPGGLQSAVVPSLAEVAEISQLRDAFHHMIADLQGATQRLEDLVFKLGTLNETVELAARIPKIQDLLGLVLQNTMRAVRATIGSIMILDSDRQTLRLAVSRGIPDEVASSTEVRVGEGIAGKVVELGEPVLVDDVASDPRFSKPNAPQYGSGSFICMPIRVADRIIGVINMAKKKEAGGPAPHPFSPTDLQFLNALLTYIGYSVDNARLLEDAQQSARQLQAVVDHLKTTQAQLVRGETLRAMGQLSSGMAHHLNNLLAVIVGRTQLLLRTVEDAGVRRALQIVERTALDGAEVVRRVQRFGRVEPVSGALAVDLNELAQEVVELTRPHWQDEAQRRGRRVEVQLAPGTIPPVAGEPAQLREVLVNVLLNATDAMLQGGAVRVRTWADGGRVHCAVIDSGVGMSEDVRRRVLEPFFTTKGPRSTGLGLSVAYGTIERHGGTLTIDSAEGQGTTVTISLPAAPAGVEAPARLTPPPPPALLRILVIDDEPEVREILADLLEAEGHTVRQASGGREGLGLLAAGERVDVVLTDLGMPEMRGSEVARTIHERWAGLPVGLVTGWGEQELTDDERRRVDFVIAKPYSRDLLREVLSGIRPRA